MRLPYQKAEYLLPLRSNKGGCYYNTLEGHRHERLCFCLCNHSCFLIPSSPDWFVMEVDATPKFSSKDEEINFWKSLYLKYKKRYSMLSNWHLTSVSLSVNDLDSEMLDLLMSDFYLSSVLTLLVKWQRITFTTFVGQAVKNLSCYTLCTNLSHMVLFFSLSAGLQYACGVRGPVSQGTTPLMMTEMNPKRKQVQVYALLCNSLDNECLVQTVCVCDMFIIWHVV